MPSVPVIYPYLLVPSDQAGGEGEEKAAAAAAAGPAEGEEVAEKSEAAEGEVEAVTPLPTEGAASDGQKLTNQFNFSERASQTYNNPYRVGCVCHISRSYFSTPPSSVWLNFAPHVVDYPRRFGCYHL